jgi:F-type H+-transporting ATPase subunit delta
MSTTISSKRYAQAVFQIAAETKQLDEWQAYLNTIAALMSNADFKAIIENPKVTFEVKSKLVKEALGKIDPMVLNFCYLLIVKNKTNLSSEIAGEYENLLDKYKGIKKAQVLTSISLDKEAEVKLTKQLEDIIGNKLSVKYGVDPSIIGGFIARIDGRLIDGSIKNRLEKLRQNISGFNN